MIEMGSPVIFNLQAPSGWQSKVDCPLAESARPCTVAAPVAQGWVAGVSSVLHWQYSAALQVQAGAHKGQQPPGGGNSHSPLPHFPSGPLGQLQVELAQLTSVEFGLMTQPAVLHSTGTRVLFTTKLKSQLPLPPPPDAGSAPWVTLSPVAHCTSRLSGTMRFVRKV